MDEELEDPVLSGTWGFVVRSGLGGWGGGGGWGVGGGWIGTIWDKDDIREDDGHLQSDEEDVDDDPTPNLYYNKQRYGKHTVCDDL